MRIDTFSSETGVVFDRKLWNELCSLRFLDHARGALILGPVGVGKTHLATALGHIAIRRRRSVLFARADQLFRQLKAARLGNSVEAGMRCLARVELLVLDDFALQGMDQVQTADFHELIVERHQKTATILTSNRDPSEWIALMSDPLLAQSASTGSWPAATSSSSKESPTAAANAALNAMDADPTGHPAATRQ